MSLLDRLKTLRGKFLLLLLPPVILATILVSGLFVALTYGQMQNELTAKQTHLSEFMGSALAETMWNFDKAGTQRLLDALLLTQDVAGVRIVDTKGVLVAQSGAPPGTDWLTTRTPVTFQSDANIYRLGTLEVVFTFDRVSKTLTEQITRNLLLLAFLVFVLLVSALLANRLIIGRPLETLLAQIRRTEAEHRHVPLEPLTRDELGDVIGAYNRLVARLLDNEQTLMAAKTSAEEANTAKTRFLAAASHDLRQPLQAITLYLEALSAGTGEEKTRDLARRITRTTESLRLLLDEILDISRLDAGLVQVQPEVFSLGRLFHKLAEEFAPVARRKNLQFRVVAPRAHVLADPRLTEIVLRNLVNNALKYTPKGKVLLGVRRRGGDFSIEVLDNGPGIEPAFQERVFEEFFQLDNPERDRRKGLGLGLSIVRRIAQVMRIEITLVSHPGQGTCFSFILPRFESSIEPIGTGVEPDRPSRPLNIMLIDDDLLVRDATLSLLSAWGHCAVADCCADPDHPDFPGLVTAFGRPPDLLLVDYRLPKGRTGTDAIAALVSAWGHGVPTLIITGDTAPQRLEEIGRSGHPTIHKPVDPVQLRRILRQVAERGVVG
ncbi:hypothetical protein JCM17960_16000 [Magnetospira thiophila]